MMAYHDAEWGIPVHDSRMLWEMLMLEGFQAGLSWRTILYRREGFRAAFRGFDPDRQIRGRDAIERVGEALQRPVPVRPDRFEDGFDLLRESAQIRFRPRQQCARYGVGRAQIVQSCLLHAMLRVPHRCRLTALYRVA